MIFSIKFVTNKPFFKQTCGDTIHVYFGSFVNSSTSFQTGFYVFSESEKKACNLLLSLCLHYAWQRKWVNNYDVI